MDGTSHAVLSKTNRYPLLYSTVNDFQIQNGKRPVSNWYGSRFNKNDKKR